MKALEIAIPIIKEFEGFRDKAYKCSAGIWTIGYGRTGPDVNATTVSTKEKEEAWLIKRVQTDLDKIEAMINWSALEYEDIEWCKAALASLVYNIGITNFKTSSLRLILCRRQDGNLATQWLKWNKVKGQTNKGLVARRAKEYAYFKIGYPGPDSILPRNPRDRSKSRIFLSGDLEIPEKLKDQLQD